MWDLNPQWTLERVIGTGESGSPLSGRVNALDFSPDGKLLATGSGDPSRSGQLKIWNVADGTLAMEIKHAHSDTVQGLDFSPDSNRLVTGAADKFVKVWELAAFGPPDPSAISKPPAPKVEPVTKKRKK